jgi:hypothetical protein
MELMIDVFMLNRFPCRMVELVGWVAGVDEKEKIQTIYRNFFFPLYPSSCCCRPLYPSRSSPLFSQNGR